MNRPRKQTYTMDMYLNKINDSDIRNDSDTQRQFVWTNEQVNELIVTVLTEDYIPPIILAEVENSQLWIVDGGQRSAALRKFRYGNYKITSAIEDSVIPYKAKVIDDTGDIVWKDATFDIKNKTYDKLPEELKKKFNEYQIETAIHEDCTPQRIAQLIKRYNNHTSMNNNQKAFTYVSNYARDVRNILDSKFFLDCGSYTEKERVKGVLERVVMESLMCIFHLDQWKKQPKQMANYLNEHLTEEDVSDFQSMIIRLEGIITDDLKDVFTSKDSFVWFTIFHRFLKTGFKDDIFADFLREFKSGIINKKINGVSFAEINENRATKDKAVVVAKVELLTALMFEYLGIGKEFFGRSLVEFVKECVSDDITEQDVETYEDISKDLICNERVDSIVSKNKPSIVSIIALACRKDVDLDEVFEGLVLKTEFSNNQKENYIYMKELLEGEGESGNA